MATPHASMNYQAGRLVSHLRCAALAVSIYAEQRSFFQQQWGRTEVHTERALSYLAAEASTEPSILRLRDGEKRVDLAAFAVANREDLHALADKLAQKGCSSYTRRRSFQASAVATASGCSKSTVACSSSPPVTRPARRVRSASVSRSPAKLSHVVFNSEDLTRTAQWYIGPWASPSRARSSDRTALTLCTSCGATRHTTHSATSRSRCAAARRRGPIVGRTSR